MSLDPTVAGLIGFAAKSGKLIIGTNAVEQSIIKKKAALVLVAQDMNPKRVEKLRLWCLDEDIPMLSMGMKDEYGQLLRKPPLGLLALTDKHMVSGIMKTAKTNGGD